MGLYTEVYRKNMHLINNYKFGASTIYEMNFEMSRGQNLQESNIGKSVYTTKYYKNFYNLYLPKNFSQYGTVDDTLYLGNSKKLKTLKQGEIIYGAEGTFRSIVVCEDEKNVITNIHGITLYHSDLNKSIFVQVFLGLLTKK